MTLKGKKTQKEILNFAISEFAQYGYNGSSINRICENNGVTKGQLYHHYKSKDELFLASLSYVYTELYNYHSLSNHFNDDPNQVLQDYLNVRLEYSNQNPVQMRFFYRCLSLKEPHLMSQVTKIRENLKRFNCELIVHVLSHSKKRSEIPLEVMVDYVTLVLDAYNLQQDESLADSENYLEILTIQSQNLLDMLFYGTLEKSK